MNDNTQSKRKTSEQTTERSKYGSFYMHILIAVLTV